MFLLKRLIFKMFRRERNKKIANETMKIIETGKYISDNNKSVDISNEISKCIVNSKLYEPEYEFNLPPCPNRKGKIQITGESTFAACERIITFENIKKVTCLNFGSGRKPGGGFLSGAQAQEETLARCSALYPTLIKNEEMYVFNNNRKTNLYSDYMIYSPDVPVFRNDDNTLIDNPYMVSIITASAINLSSKFKPSNNNDKERYDQVMLNRCRKIIYRAIENNAQAIVLGAFGCGVFRNNPVDVAEYFRKLLIDEGLAKYFDLIVHPIYTKHKATDDNYKGFIHVYNDIAKIY